MPVVPSTSAPIMARMAQRATRLGEPLFGFNLMQPYEQKREMMNTFMGFMAEQARKREARKARETVFDMAGFLGGGLGQAFTSRGEKEAQGPSGRFSGAMQRTIEPVTDIIGAFRGGGKTAGAGQTVQLPYGSTGSTPSPINPSFSY